MSCVLCFHVSAHVCSSSRRLWQCGSAQVDFSRVVAMWMWIPESNRMQDRFSADRSESLSYVLCLVFANNSQPTEVSL